MVNSILKRKLFETQSHAQLSMSSSMGLVKTSVLESKYKCYEFLRNEANKLSTIRYHIPMLK